MTSLASAAAAVAVAGDPDTIVIELQERLRRLEAIEAARSHVARYPDACDAQDLTALSALFADDAVLSVPGREHVGRTEVISFYEAAFATDPSRKSHFLTNLATTYLGEGRVRVESYFLYTAAGDATSVIGWGQYDDVVVVQADRALIERKAISIRRAVDVRDGWAVAPGAARP